MVFQVRYMNAEMLVFQTHVWNTQQILNTMTYKHIITRKSNMSKSSEHQFANVFNNNSVRCYGDDYDSDWVPEDFNFKWNEFDRKKNDLVLVPPPKIRRIGKHVFKRQILKPTRDLATSNKR